MNHEFGNIGRRLPYDLPEHRLEALHERILRNTAARPAPAPPPIVRRSPQQQTLPTSEAPFSGSDKFYPQKICINRKNTLHLHSQ